MPAHPDSPNLTSTSGRGSPIKSSFHSRNLSSMNLQDERVGELLDISKELKTQTKSVEDSVNDALVEFGGLAHRSRDNAVALSDLKDHVVKTEQSMKDTDNTIKDNLTHVKSTLDTLQENNKVISTISESLLESNKDVNRQLKSHESHLRSILSNSAEHREFPKLIKRFSDLFEEQNTKVMEVLGFIHEDISNSELKIKLTDSSKKIDSLADQFTQNKTDFSGMISKLDSISSSISDESNSIKGKIDTIPNPLSKQEISDTISESNKQQLIPLLNQVISNNHPSSSSDTNDKNFSELSAKLDSQLTKDDIKELLSEQPQNIETVISNISQKLDDHATNHDKTVKSLSDKMVSTALLDELKDKIDQAQSTHHECVKSYSGQILEKIHDRSELDANLESIKSQIVTELSSSQKDALKSLLEEHEEKTKSTSDNVENALKELFIKELQNTENTRNDKFQEFSESIQKQLTDTQSKTSKTIGDIQSDVRSLVDFQYGDISSFGEQVQTILTRLDGLKAGEDSEEKLAEANKRAQMFEERALKAEEQVKLQQEIETLKQNKQMLAQEIQSMKAELSIRNEEFNKIEQRVAGFEQRLNQAILERSKGILGSTTMTIINNNNNQMVPPNSSDSSNMGSSTKGGNINSPERTPLKANSGSKRNLSFAPEVDHVLEDVPIGKENSDLAVAKRGSPYANNNSSNNSKGRSISLFVDH